MAERKRELTTTSYTLLGLLAIQPWSTYELTKQVQRSLAMTWRRVESNLYEGPKALVAHGLATSRREYVGRRPRTVYEITDAGREALRAWLAQPGAPPSMEFEALLKILLGDASDKESLLVSIEAARDWSQRFQEGASAVARGYLDDGGPFPDRLPLISLTFPLLYEFAELVQRWADRAATEVRRWPDQPTVDDIDTEPFRRAAAAHEGATLCPTEPDSLPNGP